jgi:hypothetical protein
MDRDSTTVLGRDYWLGESEGFAVKAPGRRLGIVERLVRDDDGSVSTLVVLGGVLGCRRRQVDCRRVAEIVPSEKLLRLDRDPGRPRPAAAPQRRGSGLARLVHLRQP